MKARSLRRLLTSFAGCLLALSNSSIEADTVELTNGDRISGALKRLDHSECVLDTDFQAEIRIPLTRVARLQTDRSMAVNLKSGERIDGLVDIHFQQHALELRSERFGTVRLGTGELEGVTSRDSPFESRKRTQENRLAELHGKGTEDRRSNGDETSAKIGAEQAEQQQEEEVQQVFLRASAVLLEPGDVQLDVSLNYAREEPSQFFSTAQRRILLESRARTFVFPVIGRFGLLPGLEGFLNVPLQYQELRDTVIEDSIDPPAFNVTDQESSLFSLGDVQAGLKYAFHREDALPEMIGTFDFRAPTGRVRNPLLASAAVTGSGQWAAAGGLNLIKSFDPVVFFGGLRYEYNIFNRTAGTTFGSWSNFGYNLGLGFAVNHRVTLLGQFQGNYYSERDIGGITIPDRELATLRGGFTYKIADKQYLEPSITFGLNDISPDLIIGLSYNQRL